jgi:addiction module HigA family antidote
MRRAHHPGLHLAEHLDAMTMSATAFARIIGVPTNRVTELINGRRNITADTAIRLARAFRTSAQFWMNLQVLYDLRTAESSKSSARSFRAITPISAARQRVKRAPAQPKPATRKAVKTARPKEEEVALA